MIADKKEVKSIAYVFVQEPVHLQRIDK